MHDARRGVRADMDAALARVAGGAATPAAAWQAVLKRPPRRPRGAEARARQRRVKRHRCERFTRLPGKSPGH
jgi:hypothetical protein